MSESVFQSIDHTELDRLLAEAPQAPIVIKVTASFCQPCKMMAPRLEVTASQYPSVSFYQIQADASPEQMSAVKAQNVRTVPTLIAINGEDQKRYEGAMADMALAQWLKRTTA